MGRGATMEDGGPKGSTGAEGSVHAGLMLIWDGDAGGGCVTEGARDDGPPGACGG